MKKLLFVLLALTLCVTFLTACKKDEPDTEDNPIVDNQPSGDNNPSADNKDDNQNEDNKDDNQNEGNKDDNQNDDNKDDNKDDDKTATLVSIGGQNYVIDDNHYAAIVADRLNFNAQILHDHDLRVSDLRAILDAAYVVDEYGHTVLADVDMTAYVDAISKADIVTVEFGYEDFTGFVFAQLMGYINENYDVTEELSELGIDLVGTGLSFADNTTYEMDWTRFPVTIKKELIDFTVDYVNQILEKYEVEIVLNSEDIVIDVNVDVNAGIYECVSRLFEAEGFPTEYFIGDTEIDLVDFTTYAIETVAYAAVNYAYNYAEVIDAIHAINPRAEIFVLGLYNLFDDVDFYFYGETLNVGEYIDGFVEALGEEYPDYILFTDKVHYVDIKDYETIAEADEIVSILDFITVKEDDTIGFNNEALDATENGHLYIAEQILAAI